MRYLSGLYILTRLSSPCAFQMLNITSHPQGLGRHLFCSFGEVPSFAERSLINDDGITVRCEVSPKWGCLKPFGSCFRRWPGGLGGPGQKVHNTESLRLLPASAYAFPALGRDSNSWWIQTRQEQMADLENALVDGPAGRPHEPTGPHCSVGKIWNQLCILCLATCTLGGFLLYLVENNLLHFFFF